MLEEKKEILEMRYTKSDIITGPAFNPAEAPFPEAVVTALLPEGLIYTPRPRPHFRTSTAKRPTPIYRSPILKLAAVLGIL